MDNATLKLLPLKTKFSRCGKTPKDPHKRAKRKEIEGQAILTLKPLTMEKLENQGKKINPKKPQNPKTNTKEKGEKIRNLP